MLILRSFRRFNVASLLLLWLNCVQISLQSVRKDFKLDRYGPCENSQDDVIQLDNFQARVINQTMQFSGGINVTEDIDVPLEIETVSYRCSIDRDYCDEFDRLVIKDVCQKLSSGELFGRGFFSNIEPEIKCPLVQGTHTFNDATIDITGYLRLPVEGYRWISHTTLFQERERNQIDGVQFFCIEEQHRIMASSSRRSRKPPN